MKKNQEELDKLFSNAVARGDLHGVKDALRNGADPKQYESSNLVDATWMGHIEIAKMLIPLSDPSAYDQAMCEAGIHGHTELIEAMLPLCSSDEVMRALRTAAYNGHRETVDFLYDKCDMDAAVEILRKDEGRPTVDYLIARRQSELEANQLQAQTTKVAAAWSPDPKEADAQFDRKFAEAVAQSQGVEPQRQQATARMRL